MNDFVILSSCHPVILLRFTWRLLLEDERSPAWNMAVDEAILDAVAAGIAPPTVRLYRWDGPAVTIGRFQAVARGVDVEACRTLGVPIVRRPTGGRGILHGGDQTISLVVPISHLGDAGGSVIRSYRLLSAGIVEALAQLGLAVSLGGCERRMSAGGGECFATRTQADLIAPGEEKLVGSAQCRREGVILQQSSLRHLPANVRPAQVFIGPTGPTIYPLKDVEPETLQDALREGFRQALGGRWNRGSLTVWEEERTGVLLQKYAELNIEAQHVKLNV